MSADTLYPGDPDAPFAAPPFEVAPQPDIPDSDGVPTIRQGGTEIEVEPSLEPPPGTIPVLREQFAAYVDDPRGSQSLAEFIDNLAPPANTLNDHLKARQRTEVDVIDSHAHINLWRHGEAVFDGDMSLMHELAAGLRMGLPFVTAAPKAPKGPVLGSEMC